MSKLTRLFLSHGGAPNTLNGLNQSALHAACGGLTRKGLVRLAVHTRPTQEECGSGGGGLGALMRGVASLWRREAPSEAHLEAAASACVGLLLDWRGLEVLFLS